MKNLMLILILLFSFSCKQPPAEISQDKFQIEETAKALEEAEKYRLKYEEQLEQTKWFAKVCDSLKQAKQPAVNLAPYNKTIDSLREENNKLGKELLHNKLIIQNAKYYLNIANKNPSQQKFLRGWMNRALNQ